MHCSHNLRIIKLPPAILQSGINDTSNLQNNGRFQPLCNIIISFMTFLVQT